MKNAFIITCEHATNKIPSGLKREFKNAERVLESHRGWDPGAATVTKTVAPLLKAPCFFGTVSRLVIDLNRSLHNSRVFSQWTSELSISQRDSIAEIHYFPYRNAVETKISKLVATKSSVIHLSIHSFTPVLNGEKRNCEVGILFDPSRAMEKTFARNLKSSVLSKLNDQSDLRIRFNYPYLGRGDGFTSHLRKLHSPEKYVGIELEFNQAFIVPLLKSKRKTAFLRNLADSIQLATQSLRAR